MTIVIPIGRAAPRMPMRECVTFRCKHCGSKRVRKDSESEWDELKQAWVQAVLFEAVMCIDCGTDTRLVSEVIS